MLFSTERVVDTGLDSLLDMENPWAVDGLLSILSRLVRESRPMSGRSGDLPNGMGLSGQYEVFFCCSVRRHGIEPHELSIGWANSGGRHLLGSLGGRKLDFGPTTTVVSRVSL